MNANYSLAADVDRVAWLSFTDQRVEQFTQSWLQLVCSRVGAAGGVVITDLTQPPAASVNRITQINAASAQNAIQQAWNDQQGVVVETAGGSFQLVCPATWQHTTHAVVVIELTHSEPQQLPNALQELQWAVGWLVLPALHAAQDQSARTQSISGGALELMAEVLAEPRTELAVRALLARLSLLFDADRASFGWVSGRQVRVQHVSDMANPKKRQESLARIQAAMLEALDQNNLIRQPLHDGVADCIVRAHQYLLQADATAAVVSLPLRVGHKIVAVVTLERDHGEPFTEAEAELLEAAGTILGPALHHRRQAEAPLWRVLGSRGNRLLGGVFTLRGAAWSAAMAGLLGLIAVAIWVQLPYQLVGEAEIQAQETRLVTAPYDGYIAISDVREGDRLPPAAVLFTLNTDELQLEQLRRQGEITRLERQKQEAEGAFDRAAARQADAELSVARTELAQTDARLALSSVATPYAALVVQGDLTQRIGDTVRAGETLFSIAPADQYRVQLDIPESRVADLKLGMPGELLLAAFPDQSWPVTVRRVAPNTQFQDGGSFFRAEAELTGNVINLLPGMRGVVRLDVDERPAWQVLTRDLVDWVRLRWWSFWG